MSSKLDGFLDSIPALAPPAGTESNFIDPQTAASSLIAVNAIFLPLMLIAVVIRIYAKSCIVHAMGWDDYTCILAAMGATAHTTMTMAVIHLGYGTHMWDTRAITLTPFHLQQLESLAVIYPIVIFLVKLSIFLLYLRLFGVHKVFRYLVYFGIAFQLIFYTAMLAVESSLTVHCVSINALTIALCNDNNIIVVTQGAVNVVTDFYMLALPIPQVLHLNLKLRRKLGLLAIFMAGLIACLVSLARLIDMGVRYYDPDILYNAALTSELTVIELNLGIIAACMSALPVFFSTSKAFQSTTWKSLRTRVFGSSWSRGKSADGSYGTKDAKGSLPSARSGAVSARDRYVELHDAEAFVIEGPRKGGGADQRSRNAILRTADYEVFRGLEN
ncbi:hypothetical protein MMC27_002075 [Xylographa pallens]|nr:hypothetical protein [Xylographa pallens]